MFLLGGGLYVALECFWRGRSHISMFVAGGAVLWLFGGLVARFDALPMAALCLMGSVLITAIEFLIGAVVNVRLKLAVWDYSRLPHNLYGQVCLRYSLLWFALCAPAAVIVKVVNHL